MVVDNRTIKELSASGLDNDVPICIQYPKASQGKTEEFELKSSLSWLKTLIKINLNRSQLSKHEILKGNWFLTNLKLEQTSYRN